MSTRKYSAATPAHLLDAYAEAARAHAKATLEANPEEANRQYHELHSVYAELRRRGPREIRRLAPLLSDPHAGVRLWAATHLLEVDPAGSESVLRELAKQGDLIGFSAETTLDQWRKGNLSFG